MTHTGIISISYGTLFQCRNEFVKCTYGGDLTMFLISFQLHTQVKIVLLLLPNLQAKKIGKRVKSDPFHTTETKM
jgi:hypothetical protein